ncbi:MAG: DUF4493 domain-containing protein [Muribaculaceae bacterium]
MKKILNIFILMMTVAVTLVSCDDPTYPDSTTDQGTLKLSSLSIDVDASENQVTTRAGIDVGTFTVRVLDAATNTLKNSWIYSEMPEVVTLPVGDYVIEVYNAEVQEAAFDAPYYYASKNVTITKNDIAELGTLTCTLENVRVSIAYTDQLKAVMGDDVKVTVEVAAKNMLEFAGSETRSGYFRYYENNTTLVASFSGTVEGVFISEDHKIVTDVQPRKHYIITFDYKTGPLPDDEIGGVSNSGFSIDASVSVQNESRDINIDDEIIDPFDFLTTSISSADFTSAASSKAVTVKSSAAWTATSDQSWCTVADVTGTGFNITVAANEAATSRTANVVVAMGNLSKTIKVTQAAYSATQPAPSFSSDNINLTAYNDARLFGTDEGLLAAEVLISAPNGIKDFEVNINSGTLTAEVLQGVGLDTQFNLATGRSAAGVDLTEGLAGLGFPVANGGTTSGGVTYGPVVNQTSVTFNISQFIPLLSIYGAAYHDFELTVTDNAGQVGTCVIKFQTF